MAGGEEGRAPLEFYLLFSFEQRKFEAPFFWRKVISLNQTMKIEAHWPLIGLSWKAVPGNKETKWAKIWY